MMIRNDKVLELTEQRLEKDKAQLVKVNVAQS